MKVFQVVRVNRDPSDTHASETLEGALELAMPDEGSVLEVARVRAQDAGAARLVQVGPWVRLDMSQFDGGATMGKQASVRVDEDGVDLDHPGIAWSHYDVDPFTRECECEEPECDPGECPRFSDVCCECGESFSSGWVCMDGGETACEECVDVVQEGGAS